MGLSALLPFLRQSTYPPLQQGSRSYQKSMIKWGLLGKKEKNDRDLFAQQYTGDDLMILRTSPPNGKYVFLHRLHFHTVKDLKPPSSGEKCELRVSVRDWTKQEKGSVPPTPPPPACISASSWSGLPGLRHPTSSATDTFY